MQERRRVMELQSKKTVKTPMDDEKIVELYWERNEKAIEETDFKYKKYLFSIAYNVICNRLDCEECLNDTYLGAWNSIPPTKPNVLKAFLTTITRRIAIKRYHRNLRQNTIPSEMTISLSELEDFIAGDEDVSADFDAERLGYIISDFVYSLSDRRQFIFMSRYYVADSIDAIARDLSLSRSMVNKELAIIRSALKEKLESEGYLI
ncbi:MAG: sigma-70 family RNA polymerase sigma factor [Ruminococcaceae bacterium]|nr:sigma-70 family RNA polymerase sigma factor [Oscillospiraceae bacterium]